MNSPKDTDHGDDLQGDARVWALRYAANGRFFPVNAAKKPLVAHWRDDASADPAAIEGWLAKWRHCEFAWAMPADVLAVDVDVKHGKNGYADFKRLAGCDARDVMTPMATTPSGGLPLFFKATKAYRNTVATVAPGIDTRTEGGYVVLPLPGNGREPLHPLIGATLLPAPAWLERALRQTRTPLTLAPRSAFAPPSSDPWAHKKALAQLERACARIRGASCGAQDSTRHRECFTIGGLIGRGDLDYATAYAALLEAAQAMPVHRDPWRNLDTRVARSLEAGMGRPLALSETETWIRDFRVRMRFRRPGAHNSNPRAPIRSISPRSLLVVLFLDFFRLVLVLHFLLILDGASATLAATGSARGRAGGWPLPGRGRCRASAPSSSGRSGCPSPWRSARRRGPRRPPSE